MATVEVQVADRTYAVACRDGEEEHLRGLARTVDQKANDALAAVGNMGEARQLLFTSLLLADELAELRRGGGATSAVATPPPPDPAVAESLERLADRIERLATRLEQDAQTP